MVTRLNRHRLSIILAIVGITPIFLTVSQAADIDTDAQPSAVAEEPGPLLSGAPDTGIGEDAEPLNSAATNHPVEIINERYPNGKLKNRREVTLDATGNYIRHGEWKMWDEQGNLIAAGQYRNDVAHGQWTRIYYSADEAEIFSQMPYKQYEAPFTSQATVDNGRLHGTWVILDSKQRKISEWEYANGLRHGARKWTYASGKPMKEAIYCEGLLHGPLRVWDTSSRLIAHDNYEQGRKLATKIEYDEDGNKIAQGVYLHAQHVVDKPVDWWNVKPSTYKQAGEDIRHGPSTTWFRSGQKSKEGAFQHGHAEGPFSWWYANGQERMIGSYKAGKQHGPWVWWHENGQKASQGHYVNGEPTGTWTFWNNDGRLSRKADFSEETDSVAVRSGASEEKREPPSETSQSGSETTTR